VNVYPFIEAEKRCRRNVKRACELLKVSRAAFYAYLAGPSQREREDAELTGQVQAVHQESQGRYGAPRVPAELRRRGHRHGRKRVVRLMRQAGLQGRAARRWKKTTIADPAAAARVDAIRRDFTADASNLNARWCGDITYSAQLAVMCSPVRRSSVLPGDLDRGAAHNQRPSRKARSRSPGWNRAGAGLGSVRRRSTASLVARSASRYWCVTAGLEWPSHNAMTVRSVPDCSRCMAVEWRLCGISHNRHTAAMTLLKAGVDTSVIALWLGHEGTETTRVYLNSQELHQPGEKPQVTRSRRCRNSVPALRVATV
jgi:hypothetical protein